MRKSTFSSPLSPSDVKNRKIPDGSEFILKGFTRGNVGLLIANEGGGKSGLAHLLANDMACGTNFSGLNPVKGKVIFISLEDREIIWSKRQRKIEEDLTDEQIALAEKNIQIHDLKEHSHTLSNNTIYNELLAHCQEFKPDIVIIDYLEKFAEKELTDVPQAHAIGKAFEHMAVKLDCGFLFLHHTTKSANEDEVGIRGMSAGATQFGRVVKWRALLKEDKRKEGHSILKTDKSDDGRYTIPYVRRNDRMGIPYCNGKADTIKEQDLEDSGVVDLTLSGGRSPKSGLIPMNIGLIKQDGVFASFSSNQVRPKLDVRISFENNKSLHIYGPDMLGPSEAKILLAIVAKLNSEGIRICLPNGARDYQNLLDKIEEYSSFSMQIETTYYELYTYIKGNYKPCPDAYKSIKWSLKRLKTATIFFQNNSKEYGLSLIDYFDMDDSSNKINLKLNPFLVESILGIGGVAFTLIPIDTLKNLTYDPSFILYQRIKSIIRKTDKKGVKFKIDTLLEYLYPFECKSASMRKERLKTLRKAIKEIGAKTDILFEKDGKSYWKVYPKGRNFEPAIKRRGS